MNDELPTNVVQLPHTSQTMRSLITKLQPEDPPQPNTRLGYFRRGQRGTLRGGIRISYGWDVPTEENNALYGADLCQLVEQCLRHFPADRILLPALLTAIAAGIAASPLMPADIAWMAGVLGPPGPPVHLPWAATTASGAKIPAADLP
ncbi:unnamed protein product [Discula destructiva]